MIKRKRPGYLIALYPGFLFLITSMRTKWELIRLKKEIEIELYHPDTIQERKILLQWWLDVIDWILVDADVRL